MIGPPDVKTIGMGIKGRCERLDALAQISLREKEVFVREEFPVGAFGMQRDAAVNPCEQSVQGRRFGSVERMVKQGLETREQGAPYAAEENTEAVSARRGGECELWGGGRKLLLSGFTGGFEEGIATGDFPGEALERHLESVAWRAHDARDSRVHRREGWNRLKKIRELGL